MPVFSKLAYFLGLPIVNTNCYETMHTWQPHCNQAILDCFPNGVWFCLKTYAPFYLISSLVAKRGDFRKVDWKRYCIDVIRSSIFLTANLLLFIFFICRVRHVLGFFTPISMGLISSMLGSFFSLLIEKRSRWPALALYLTNLASETLFRQLHNHGYIPKVNKGEVIPFIIGMGLFFSLYTAGRLNDSTKNLLKFTHNLNGERDIVKEYPLPKEFRGFLYELRRKYGRTDQCVHQNSCVSTVAESFGYNFTIGLGASVALTLAQNVSALFSNPSIIREKLFSKSILRIPTFYGLMPLIFHTVRCTLNRLPQSSHKYNNIVAGTASGLAMLAFPNVSIAMYVLWKAIELIFRELVKQGIVRPMPYGDLFLYTVSTAYVLWQIVIEPQAIRKGYLKFLLGLTGNRMSLLNRDLYEHFGYQSRLLFPYRPTLDPKYVTMNPMLYQPISPP
uniref:TMEM135_C_rich domain-containing protein n=1 Tax=Haemonchus contortus TaxID=6289 RepID=A0A7I4Z2U4_HAECO